MTDKPPVWADLLLNVWVLVVAVIFFGPGFYPRLGLWTEPASAFYGVMVLVSAAALALKYLRRHDAPEPPTNQRDTRPKKRNPR